MNSFTLNGKIKDDFKISKVGDSNVAKATMIIDRKMSKEKKEDAKSKGYPTADFPRIEIWGSDAKIALLNDNVKKGDKILVKGYYKTGSYTKGDKKVYTTIINVTDFDIDFKPKTDFDNIDL